MCIFVWVCAHEVLYLAHFYGSCRIWKVSLLAPLLTHHFCYVPLKLHRTKDLLVKPIRKGIQLTHENREQSIKTFITTAAFPCLHWSNGIVGTDFLWPDSFPVTNHQLFPSRVIFLKHWKQRTPSGWRWQLPLDVKMKRQVHMHTHLGCRARCFTLALNKPIPRNWQW